MAQVLLCTMPSGRAAVVAARKAVFGLVRHLAGTEGKPSACSVQHVTTWDGCISGANIYVGQGGIDVQGRPAAHANPYFFLEADPRVALQRFTQYVAKRADRRWWLTPLFGRTLVCDCERPEMCHAEVLAQNVAELVAQEVPIPEEPGREPTDAVAQWAALREEVAQHEASDSEGESCGPGPKSTKEERRRVNETIRGGRPLIGAERPSWPAAWLLLVTVVRAAVVPLFWQVFSGAAGLSNAFAENCWRIAPPIDS